MSLGDAAARGTGVVMASQAARIVVQFGSVVVLARLLTPEDFGLVAMVTAIIGIAEIIRDFGLSSAAIQSKTLTDDERTNLFWANFGLGAACAVIAIACQPLIVAFYDEPRLNPLIIALGLIFVISGANTQYKADLIRRMRYRQLVTSDLVAQLIAVIAAIVLAVAGAGLWAIVVQQIATAVIALAINVAGVRWLPGLPKPGVSLRRFFRFGAGVLGTQALAYVTKSVSNVAIGAYWGAAPLGLYNRAYQLLMTPLNQINAPLTNVALPVLSRVNDDEDTYARYLGKAQLVACYLTATLLAVAAGLALPATLVLFGSRWAGVAPIFAWLAIGGIFRSIGQVAYWIFLSRGLTGAQLKMDLIMRPLMIAMMVAGLPWGPTGVAIGHLVAFFSYWVVAFVYVGRKAQISVRPLFLTAGRAIVVMSAPAGVAAWTATLLPLPAVVQLLVGVLFALAYCALAAALIGGIRADLRDGLDLVRRALRRRGSKPAPAQDVPGENVSGGDELVSDDQRRYST